MVIHRIKFIRYSIIFLDLLVILGGFLLAYVFRDAVPYLNRMHRMIKMLTILHHKVRVVLTFMTYNLLLATAKVVGWKHMMNNFLQ